MRYPLNEQAFIDKWVSALDNPDEEDRALATAIVKTINGAYNEGIKKGMEGMQYDK